MDKILRITKDIEQNCSIDLTETQTMIVSFQKIAEVRQHQDCEQAINDALKVITQDISVNTIQSETDDLLDMYMNTNQVIIEEVSDKSVDVESKNTS